MDMKAGLKHFQRYFKQVIAKMFTAMSQLAEDSNQGTARAALKA